MDARALDHIRDVESKFETDEEIYQLRRKITLPQAKLPELVDIGKGFFISVTMTSVGGGQFMLLTSRHKSFPPILNN